MEALAAEPIPVHCPTCLRRERWVGADRVVVQQGGTRRPAEHPDLAAWNTLHAARSSGEVVVERCICGQPLLAPTGEWMDWTIDTPQGAITVQAEGQVGPKGPIALERMAVLMNGWFGSRLEIRPFQWAFQLVAMLSIVAPAMLWLAAAMTVVFILFGLMQQPGFR